MYVTQYDDNLVTFFSKGTATAPTVDLDLNTLRGTKAAFLSQKRYNKQPFLII